jgi:hypothetical protein
VRWDDSGDTSSWLEADKIEKVAGVVGNTCNNTNNLFPSPVLPGTHFTCFIGTKVQILTQLRILPGDEIFVVLSTYSVCAVHSQRAILVSSLDLSQQYLVSAKRYIYTYVAVV